MSKSEQLQHELVLRIKELASELGRTPTKAEFITRYYGADYRIRTGFGSYTVLLKAAGLDTYEERRSQKITNEIFRRDISTHLKDYQPRAITEQAKYPSAAIISDIHWPFANQRVVDKFLEYVSGHQPHWVIINGDAWDMYSHSKYPRSHNVFTPRDEQSLAREKNTSFWKSIREKSPNSKCVQMMGNHDIRPLKRVLEVYPAAEDWVAKALEELFTFDGVKTVFDSREELFLNETTIVFHGYRSQLGAHRDYTLLNCINGHTHLGGVSFRRIRGTTIYELNSGVAGDPESKGLSYTPQKITHWTPGFGVIDQFGPRFISV